jgi:ribosomal protein L21E
MNNDFQKGDIVRVNANGDIAMDADGMSRFIGELGTVIQKNKSGLYMVDFCNGNRENYPKKNLDFVAPGTMEPDNGNPIEKYKKCAIPISSLNRPNGNFSPPPFVPLRWRKYIEETDNGH